MSPLTMLHKTAIAAGIMAACLFAITASAMAQNRDPYAMYGPSSQPGASARWKPDHVLAAIDRTTGQNAGKTMDRVVFIDVLDLRPYDGPGGTYVYPGNSLYSYTLLNENDGRGNHVLFGVVERPDDTGLMGIWHLDGNTLDSSGNGNHGVVSDPDHLTPSTGVSGTAFHFDGQTNINVGNLNFTGGAYTVNLWMRTTYPGGESDYRTLINKADIPSGDQTFELLMGDGRTSVPGAGGNAPMYLLWDGGQGVVTTYPEAEASGFNARDGKWHMVTATYTQGRQRFYIDGALFASRSYNGPLPIVPEGVTIGGMEGFGPYHHRWIGDLDEVSIYSRELSASEVARLAGLTGSDESSSVLATLTLSAANTPGGVNVTGNVTLTSPAPLGGAVVALSSSNGAFASVPSSVTVPEGATGASFTISTVPVSAQVSVVISASYAGAAKGAVLQVRAAYLYAIGVSPYKVKGGTGSTVKIILSGPAKAGGQVVNLASANPAVASLQASVTVPAGATEVTVPVSTSAVGVTTDVEISGNLAGETRISRTTLRVYP